VYRGTPAFPSKEVMEDKLKEYTHELRYFKANPYPEEIRPLAQITAPHLCAGLIFSLEEPTCKCIEAAPILHYMRGWNVFDVRNYCRKKKWELIFVIS
jgi:hypothetical protein